MWSQLIEVCSPMPHFADSAGGRNYSLLVHQALPAAIFVLGNVEVKPIKKGSLEKEGSINQPSSTLVISVFPMVTSKLRRNDPISETSCTGRISRRSMLWTDGASYIWNQYSK